MFLLRGLDRLVLLRCFRPDVISSAAREFISEQIGPEFVVSPTFDLGHSFVESTPATPIILMLSSGVDPLSAIQSFKVVSKSHLAYYSV